MSPGLAEGVLAGQPGAMAKAITLVESGGTAARELLRSLRPNAGRAHVVGVTGAPGAGKSTLVNQLVKEFRRRGRTVGVIAVDPSSPITGGAILGDRVRMQELAGDPGVFVRSMATRGMAGGLARATQDAVTVLDASGKDVVLVETVGVGQDEIDVVGAAHTTVVVMVPGMGDDIQALKAGLLEVADVFAVNKSDLPGADAMALQLNWTLSLGSGSRVPPVLKTVALSGHGVPELVDAVEAHRSHPMDGRENPRSPKRDPIGKRIIALAGRELLGRLEAETDAGRLAWLTARVRAGECDLGSAAEELVEAFLGGNFGARAEDGTPPRRHEDTKVHKGRNGE